MVAAMKRYQGSGSCDEYCPGCQCPPPCCPPPMPGMAGPTGPTGPAGTITPAAAVANATGTEDIVTQFNLLLNNMREAGLLRA